MENPRSPGPLDASLDSSLAVRVPSLLPPENVDERGGEISVTRGCTELAERALAGTRGSCAAAVTLTDAAGGRLAESPEGPAAAVTHPDVSGLVAVQWEYEEGPVPAALASGRPVTVSDVLSETRWPRFRAMSLQRGLRACATLPYRHEGTVLTVSLYAFRPHGLAGVDERKGAELAELAAGVLGRDRRYRKALVEVEQLNSALRSRPVVDQACGIVMGREGCDAEEAFGLLRTLSQRTNRRLAELAEAIVRNRGRGVEEHLGKLRRSR
ncbi:GAF and ANTAR domain-containing protein [Streptomyces marispadix]|uniref:GAF and ANTAR domain-containing protein n=1 Tax=Streptomyces marispadix TaxID=2922868 RepID=A0ABS9T4I1_9ACTN|nr:GAF and ANTAR domain-containing protein [Streptomyces marispadix]MCH6163437.1 GAF and ANTAR domain-containing protein [Streptomyces marispadix]